MSRWFLRTNSPKAIAGEPEEANQLSAPGLSLAAAIRSASERIEDAAGTTTARKSIAAVESGRRSSGLYGTSRIAGVTVTFEEGAASRVCPSLAPSTA